MKAWIIYNKTEAKRNKHYIMMYFNECKKRNIDLSLLLAEEITIGITNNTFTTLYKRIKQSLPEFIICRTTDPILTKHFEINGVPVFNNSFVSSTCNNKKNTYEYIAKGNVNIMDTFFINNGSFDNDVYPVVVKPAEGKGGKNVFLVKNSSELNRILKKYGKLDLIVQKAASDLGRDLRVYVIGKKIIASMLRTSNTDFRSNYCLGGTAEIYNLNASEKKQVYKIIDMFDFGLVGIDFVFDSGKPIFNEIEDVVGARMLYVKTNINIVSKYLDHILSVL